MKLFKKEYNFTFDQMAILKLSLLSGGIVIGAYFSDYLLSYWMVFLALWAVGAAYIISTQLK